MEITFDKNKGTTLLTLFQEILNDATEMDEKSLQNLLIEKDKITQPVYSWLCDSNYSQFLLKFFKEISNDLHDE